MSAQKKDKKKPLGILGAIPEFIGVMAGISMVASRWIRLHIKNLLQEKKKPVHVEPEKKIAAVEDKTTRKRVKTKKKRTKKKKKISKKTTTARSK